MSRQPNGINISEHNKGEVDYKLLKKGGVSFVYHNATTGGQRVDRDYKKRRNQAKSAGMAFGAMHQARPKKKLKSANRQANHFVKVANFSPGDLTPAVAIYETDGMTRKQLEKWAMRFSDRVKAQTGHYPVILTPLRFSETLVPGLRWFPRHAVKNVPPPRKNIDLWQYTSEVPGVEGSVYVSEYMHGAKLSDFKTRIEEAGYETLHVMHASMQYTDTGTQKKHDVKKIFQRAKRRDVAWITGTEAAKGGGILRDELRKQANNHGYRFYINKTQDSWIAVRRSLILRGWKTYYKKVLSGVARQYGNKGVLSVTFNTRELGIISIIASHYLTRGARPGHERYSSNKSLAKAIDDYARRVGRGKKLVFYGGDQNIQDNLLDTFFGGIMLSSWDELKKWPGTGHGNIDVIARSSKDNRVEAVYARSLRDNKFFLHTDHFLIETGYKIKKL